jgi:hypothetical protein
MIYGSEDVSFQAVLTQPLIASVSSAIISVTMITDLRVHRGPIPSSDANRKRMRLRELMASSPSLSLPLSHPLSVPLSHPLPLPHPSRPIPLNPSDLHFRIPATTVPDPGNRRFASRPRRCVIFAMSALEQSTPKRVTQLYRVVDHLAFFFFVKRSITCT